MNPLLLGPLFEFGKEIIDRILPNPEAKAAANERLIALQQTGELARLNSVTEIAKAQIALNTAEVQSGAWLGKWRGALGWGLTASLMYQLILYPLLIAVIVWITPTFPVEKLPKLDWQQLGSILLGMLGLGG